MKYRILSLLVMLTLWAGMASLPAAETNSAAPTAVVSPSPVVRDVNDLVTRINTKLSEGRNKEADLADNLREFDILLSKHKAAAPQERLQISVMKAKLYLQVLNNPEAALEIFKQIRQEVPEAREMADANIAMLEHAVELHKIQQALAIGAKFPDFSEKDIQGNPLSVSKLKGKVVLVDFWATWCPPCLMELPNVLKTYEKFHGQGFEIIGISLDENRPQLENFLKQRNMTWPQFNDGQRWQNKLAVKYGVQGIPTTYLIDRAGNIFAANPRGAELEQAVAKALATR
jgi:peroxiredoxin